MADHILVVDDEQDFKHIISLVFKQKIRENQYRFSFAFNGREALSKLKEHDDINLVLTDLNMPEMNGLALLKEIRELKRYIKSVVVSAYGDMPNIRTAMNYGAFDFLIKPINLKDLEITVEKSLKEIGLYKQSLRDRDQLIEWKKELDIAQKLQMSMMPRLPADWAHFRLGGQILLSSKVGGDFWDLIELTEGELLLVLGDCSGHGLGSALIMSAIRHSLRTLATQLGDYRDFVPTLNHIVYQEFSARFSYATMVFVHLRKDSRTLRLLRAGHEVPLLRRNGRLLPPNYSGGLPVGLFPKRDEDEWLEFELEPGDELYLYTDGVIDGMPDATADSLVEILSEGSEINRQLEDKAFFAFLEQNHGWKSLDDATFIKLHLGDRPEPSP